jgi:hypothetical protein
MWFSKEGVVENKTAIEWARKEKLQKTFKVVIHDLQKKTFHPS